MIAPNKTTKRKPRNAERKRFFAIARVSSTAQEKEGTSFDVQEAALRAYAREQGGEIVRLWRIAETASKSERRASFKELLALAKANASNLDGLLVYKVDRAARNMADYGRLLELEVTHGVPLIAISQPTQDTPAGRMARNMMAANLITCYASRFADFVGRVAPRDRQAKLPGLCAQWTSAD